MEITQKQIKELVDYCPETGVFTHRERHRELFTSDISHRLWNCRHAGKVSGAIQVKGNGYRRVRISLNGKQYLAHRIAWIYMTGTNPPEQIDHIDGDSLNNKWSNIRNGSDINQRNKGIQRNNSSGFSGVSWSKSAGKWLVRIWVVESGCRVYKHFGVYSDFNEAVITAKRVRESNDYSARHGGRKPY